MEKRFDVKTSIRNDLKFSPTRLKSSAVQPESVALLFEDGSAFGVSNPDVVVGGYIGNCPNVQKAYGDIFAKIKNQEF